MSNRRLAHTYTLQAEFDGQGVLVADPYPLYPRAFLWAHLDDGIMESVTTNWGNEGIYMEGVGPSLVGRAVPGLGPLQQINLGGALQFDADGNLAYDPTNVEHQIAALTAQLTTLQQQFAALNDQVELLYATLKSTAFNPYGQASLAGAGALAAALATPFSLAVPAMQANGNLQAVIGFQLPMAPRAFAAVGSLTAAALNALNMRSAMTGAGAANVALIQVPSTVKQLGSQLFAGAGGGVSKLGIGLAASATLAGASNLNVSLLTALGSSTSFAGASTSAAKLIQVQRISRLLSGSGGASIDVQLYRSAFDPVHKGAQVILSNNNLTATVASAPYQSGSAIGTSSRSNGKLYFEVHQDVPITTGDIATAIGVVTTGFDVSLQVGQDVYSWGMMAADRNGRHDNNTDGGGIPAIAGVVYTFMVAIDFNYTGAGNNTAIYFGVNGSWSNSGAPIWNNLPPNTLLYPAVSPWSDAVGNPSQLTLNIGTTAFNYTPLSGFSAWG